MGDLSDKISVNLIPRVAIQTQSGISTPTNLRARAIVALTALSEAHEITRSALCGLLWPESEPHLARGSLRQTLRRLRTDLEVDSGLFDFQRELVRFLPDDVDFDFRLLIEDIANGSAPDLLLHEISPVDRYLSDLEGITPELDAWIAVRRRLFADALTGALQARAEVATSNTETIWLANAMLRVDATDEAARRALMTALSRQGNQAAALRVYNELYELLDQEYDIEPEAETVELNARIKLGELGSVEPSPPQEKPLVGIESVDVRPTILLAPFQRLDSNRLSNAGAAFERDLLTTLIRFREWNIVSSSVEYRNGQAYLLEGSEIDSEATNTRLIMTLKKHATGQYLWSETFDLSHENWGNVQSEIARRFAVSIDTNISADKLGRSSHLVPRKKSVFERWLYCTQLNSVWTPESTREISALLGDIVSEEPSFAPAHADLAANYNSQHIRLPGYTYSSDVAERALEHSRIALSLDPLETRSQRVMAWTYLMRNEHELAKIFFDQAIELNAANPATMMSSAQGFAFCGDDERAMDLANTALKLQPNLPAFLHGYLVAIHYLGSRYDEAVQSSRKAAGSIPDMLGWEAAALWDAGFRDEAKETAAQMEQHLNESWQSKESMTRDSMLNWFVDCFPIRDTGKREQLEDSLRAALN